MVRSSERRNGSKGGMIVAKEVDPLETTRARALPQRALRMKTRLSLF